MKTTRFLFAIALALGGWQAAHAAPAGEIVSLAGKGEYRGLSARDWVAAKVRQALEGGSFVRTVATDAKMGVLLADRTQFTLQGVATAQVKDPVESTAGKSIVDMVKGTGRFQSKTPAKGFMVRIHPHGCGGSRSRKHGGCRFGDFFRGQGIASGFHSGRYRAI